MHSMRENGDQVVRVESPTVQHLLFTRSETLRVCYTTLGSANNEFGLYAQPATKNMFSLINEHFW